jgi:hypothetical protein
MDSEKMEARGWKLRAEALVAGLERWKAFRDAENLDLSLVDSEALPGRESVTLKGSGAEAVTISRQGDDWSFIAERSGECRMTEAAELLGVHKFEMQRVCGGALDSMERAHAVWGQGEYEVQAEAIASRVRETVEGLPARQASVEVERSYGQPVTTIGGGPRGQVVVARPGVDGAVELETRSGVALESGADVAEVFGWRIGENDGERVREALGEGYRDARLSMQTLRSGGTAVKDAAPAPRADVRARNEARMARQVSAGIRAEDPSGSRLTQRMRMR